jgi:hypothetical protein
MFGAVFRQLMWGYEEVITALVSLLSLDLKKKSPEFETSESNRSLKKSLLQLDAGRIRL